VILKNLEPHTNLLDITTAKNKAMTGTIVPFVAVKNKVFFRAFQK